MDRSLQNLHESIIEPNQDWINGLWRQIEERRSCDTLPGISREDDPKNIGICFDRMISAMSFNELQRCIERLHGVSDAIEEETTVAPLPSLLHKMQAAVMDDSIVPLESKQAFLRARELNSAFVGDEKLALGFLRAEDFQVNKAAQRMALYFETKKRFFGIDALVRSLTLNDLNDQQHKTLLGGGWQILPDRDRSGRLVIFDHLFCGPQVYTSLFDQVSFLLQMMI